MYLPSKYINLYYIYSFRFLAGPETAPKIATFPIVVVWVIVIYIGYILFIY